MDKITMILQFIVGLTIIVGIHELGHMLMARLFGIRVEHYMIGFPPKIFSIKYGHTDYILGAIPLGGSAKLAGMVDESFDKESLNSPPKEWEYRSKPAWQRLIVILGGIIFNMISGILIFITLTYYSGHSYISKDILNKNGIYPTQLGKDIGFKESDKILEVNNKNYKSFEELQDINLFFRGKLSYKVLRGNKEIFINVPKSTIKFIAGAKSKYILFEPLCPYIIKKIIKYKAADKAGLQKNDIIISINNEPTQNIQQLQHILLKYKGKTTAVKFLRDDTEYTTIMDIGEEGEIGVGIEKKLPYIHENYSIFQSILTGTKSAFKIVWTNILALKQMITGKLPVAKSLKGPVGIAKVFGKTFNFLKFWYIVAFLSMIIAFTNLLPIPALDGGHMILLFYEMISGKPVPTKIAYRIQIVGTVILLSIVAFTFINDIIRLFK